MNDKLAWYISRSSGWVAFVLLTLTVVWGILGITKIVERKGLPRWLMDLHKYLALLTIVFTAVHLGALVADNFVHIGWREILVPYAFDWKPGAVTFGIAAFYLVVAVQVSSWLRSRLPRKVWRATHMLSYPALWLAAMHGLRAGTDSSNLGVRIGVIAIVVVTSGLTLRRILTGRTTQRAVVVSAAASTLQTPFELLVKASLDPASEPEREATLIGQTEIVGEPPPHLVQIQAAKNLLHDALRKVQEAAPARQPAAEAQPEAQSEAQREQFVERRKEARTLVDDAQPRS
jgi:methionine sulfoxide reductase heme-binding subunit